jgi:hypothetical protein
LTSFNGVTQPSLFNSARAIKFVLNVTEEIRVVFGFAEMVFTLLFKLALTGPLESSLHIGPLLQATRPVLKVDVGGELDLVATKIEECSVGLDLGRAHHVLWQL